MSRENLVKSYYDSKYVIQNQILLKTLQQFTKTNTTINIIRRFSHNTFNRKSERFIENKKFTLENVFKYPYQEIFNSYSENLIYKPIDYPLYKEEEKEEIKKSFLLSILQQRKVSAKKISIFLKNKIEQIKIKKAILLKTILNKRNKYIIKIHSHIRSYLLKKSINCIFNCEYVFFYYPSQNLLNSIQNQKINKINSIKCKIYNKDSQSKEILFQYCKYLDIYFLSLSNLRVIKKKYRVNFIINENTIIDPRYEVDVDKKGNFFNLIQKKMIYRFKKKFNFVKEEHHSKFWESIFEIKKKNNRANSFDSISFTNSNISNEGNNNYYFENEISNKYQIKSILKNSVINNINKNKIKTKRKVSFNKKIFYYY